MVGTLWWNLIFALFGAAFVLLLSIGENTLTTTAIRSTATFTLFFIMLFLFRWAIGYSVENRKTREMQTNSHQDGDQDAVNEFEPVHDSSTHSLNNEDMLVEQTNRESETEQALSEEEAKKTSEMIRSLLDEE